MHHRTITPSQLRAYARHLRAEERSPATVESYLRAVRAFAAWLGGAAVHKQALLDWREHLRQVGYAPATINARLADILGHSSVETTMSDPRAQGERRDQQNQHYVRSSDAFSSSLFCARLRR